jgi:hypothetical protein
MGMKRCAFVGQVSSERLIDFDLDADAQTDVQHPPPIYIIY